MVSEKPQRSEAGACVVACGAEDTGPAFPSAKLTADLRPSQGSAALRVGVNRDSGRPSRCRQAGLDVSLLSLHGCLPPCWGPHSPLYSRAGRSVPPQDSLDGPGHLGEDAAGTAGPREHSKRWPRRLCSLILGRAAQQKRVHTVRPSPASLSHEGHVLVSEP